MTHDRFTGVTCLVDEASGPAHVAPAAPMAPMARAARHRTADDWDALLVALTARLRMAAGGRRARASSATRLQRLQQVVRECADDLALLHAGLLRQSVSGRADTARAAASQGRIVRAIAGVGPALHGSLPRRGGAARLGRRTPAFYRTFN